MTIWVPVVITIGLCVVSLRMWMEFTQRTRRINAETAHARSLIDNHTETLAFVKAKIENIKNDNETLLQQRSEMEFRVQEARAKLTQLEERLERSRPARFRIDNTDKTDELF